MTVNRQVGLYKYIYKKFYVAASVAGYWEVSQLCLSFDLCCKLIISSEDDITAEIKDFSRGTLTKITRLRQKLGRAHCKSWQGFHLWAK